MKFQLTFEAYKLSRRASYFTKSRLVVKMAGSDSPCRIMVMASGFGSNFQALIDGVSSGKLQNSRIISLITNRKNAHATVRADEAGTSQISSLLTPYENSHGTRHKIV